MNVIRIAMLCGLCAVLTASHVSLATVRDDSCAEAEDPNAAPGFTLADPNGKPVSLGDFKGKIVVLEWFNYDCPFVKALHGSDTVETLLAKYDPNKVVWLAINSTYYATAKADQEFIKEHKLAYPILLDADGKVGNLYQAKTTPHIFIIDSHGKIAYQGAIDNAPMAKKPDKEAYINYTEKAIDELLAGKEVSIKLTKPYGCSVKYPPAEKSALK